MEASLKYAWDSHVFVCGHSNSHVDTWTLVSSMFHSPRGQFGSHDSSWGIRKMMYWRVAWCCLTCWLYSSLCAAGINSIPWVIFLSGFSQTSSILNVAPLLKEQQAGSSVPVPRHLLESCFSLLCFCCNGVCWLYGLVGCGPYSQLHSQLAYDSSPQMCWLFNGVSKPWHLQEASDAKLFPDSTLLESESEYKKYICINPRKLKGKHRSH